MLTITASEIQPGDFIPGLGDAYVFDVETNEAGYLSYPRTDGGYDAAMPEDTIVVTFHDHAGNENYMILDPGCRVEVQR